MGAFLLQLLAPLLTVIEFATGLFPHLAVIQRNERGVLYPAGGEPRELRPEHWACPAWAARVLLAMPTRRLRALALAQGVHVYFPAFQTVAKHHSCAQVLDVQPICVETEDTIPFAVGLVLVYRIVDVLTFEVEFLDADDSLMELAEGALRKLVLKSTAAELRDHRVGIDRKLRAACENILEDVGVEILSARLTEQTAVSNVSKVFGLNLATNLNMGGE